MSRSWLETRRLLALSWPMIVTNLAWLGMRFTDTVFAGRISSADLAGISVGGDIWIAVFLFLLGLLLAVSPTVAHQVGAGETTRVGHSVRQSAWLAILFTLPAMLIMISGEPLMRFIGVDPEVIPIAGGYLDAIVLGLPAMALYTVLRHTTEAVSHTRPLLLVAIISVILNIFADWVFMYGKLGVPAMGAIGTGYASALVQWVMFISMLVYMLRARLYRPYAIFSRFEWPAAPELKALFLLGFPIAIAVFMEGSMFSAVGLMLATLGKTVVAGHTIAINWTALMFMVPLGFAGGITVRVGQALGRGDPQAARFAGWIGVSLCTLFMALSALALLLFADSIISIYTSDAAVSAVAFSLLMVAAIFQVFDGGQVALAGVLRGYKDTRAPMIYTVIAYWLLGFPTAWYFGLYLGWGAPWVWVGLIVGLGAAGLMMGWHFVRRGAAECRQQTVM
ncbi:MAG: MATE family efflux transporter [Gammaproteobacteria bacterium]|nr:MATE family efflux transporter [Gammaproteobacteria bacterium]